MLTDSPLSIAGQPHRVLLTIPGAAEPHRVLLSTPTRSTLLPDPTQESTTAAAVTADSGGMWKGSDVSINSPMDSPMVRRAAVNLLLGVPSPVNDSISSKSFTKELKTYLCNYFVICLFYLGWLGGVRVGCLT